MSCIIRSKALLPVASFSDGYQTPKSTDCEGLPSARVLHLVQALQDDGMQLVQRECLLVWVIRCLDVQHVLYCPEVLRWHIQLLPCLKLHSTT